MTEKTYDRTQGDVGNIIALEHVNITVPSQELATLFYITGLGFTRDPFMSVGRENMWANVGGHQFHLPTRGAQVLRGHVGLVVANLDELLARLEAVKAPLADTAFGFAAQDGCVAVTGPWGNTFRCYEADPERDDRPLGIRYVEFSVPQGAAIGIGRFYQEVMLAPCKMEEDGDGVAARVGVGLNQALLFRETSGELSAYDGHHIAVYVANFSGPHAFLKHHGLVTEESSAHQYRFQEIVDPETQEALFTIEHEVRSLHHPMHGREMVNRNPSQSLGGYARGRDRL